MQEHERGSSAALENRGGHTGHLQPPLFHRGARQQLAPGPGARGRLAGLSHVGLHAGG
jgi:hypothetical protein